MRPSLNSGADEDDEDDDFYQYDLKEVLAKLQALSPVSLEEMLTGADYFNLPASDLQRAIVRAIDGEPLGELADNPEVVEAFGGTVTSRIGGKPLEVDILSAIRAGKSVIAACTAVHWTQTCDLSRLRPGDIARISIVSLTRKNAQAVYSHIVHSVETSPRLKALVVGKPGADTVVFQHPSERHVEVCVVAGTRAGGSLVSTWSAGVIFDEYTRMVGDEEGVINYDEMHAAVVGRLLPNAQIVSIGSPYGSTGPAYRRHAEFFGKPGARVLVVRAPGWVMNPSYWTPARCEKFKVESPDEYRTDCAALFSSPEDAMFPVEYLQRSTRESPLDLPFERGAEYAAAMDPGTRSNAWTLVVATRRGQKRMVATCRQWVGTQSDPLDPDLVLSEIAHICANYGIKVVWSDQVMADALRSMARVYGLSVVEKRFSSTQRLSAYTNLKMRMGAGEIELAPDNFMRDDLLRVRKRIVAGGAQIILPQTSDGRHCDYAPATVLVMSKWMNDVSRPIISSAESRSKREEEQAWKAVAKKLRRRAA